MKWNHKKEKRIEINEKVNQRKNWNLKESWDIKERINENWRKTKAWEWMKSKAHFQRACIKFKKCSCNNLSWDKWFISMRKS